LVVEFQILGPLRVLQDGVERLVRTPPKPRLVLASLLARKEQRCSPDWLVAAVWGDASPASARRNLQQYISLLRKELGAERIRLRPGGYEIIVERDELDADRFRGLAADGATALAAGDLEAASRTLRSALDLWRGGAFADFRDSEPISAIATQLEYARQACFDQWAQAEMALGRHAELVSPLAELVQSRPLDERLAGHLMLVLYRSGRQSEALQAYRDIHAALREHLAVEPGHVLQDLHASMLRGDQALVAAPSSRTPASAPCPRELPAAVSDFTGRDDALRRLDTWHAAHQLRSAGPVVISAISGIGGVGKTALAVHWSHLVADSFPDGQLYVNLRGYHQQEPMEPARALGQLLRSLGVKVAGIPPELDAAAALYRSLLADKRVLILLDNAATADQVRPLLPANAGCLVVVTSRDHLTGLIARDGARRLVLDTLNPAESLGLLRNILGRKRVDGTPEAAAELAELCDHLPLALRVAAANLCVREHLSICDYVQELSAGSRLSGLDLPLDPDSSIQTVFAQSYRGLPILAARLFRLLGVVPTADFTIAAAAALTGWDLPETRRNVAFLTNASLVSEYLLDRFAMHDLVKDYAAELAQAMDVSEDRAAARGRLFTYLMHTAYAAGKAVSPHTEAIALTPATPRMPCHEFRHRDEALAWFAAERAGLLAILDYTAREKLDDYTWQLAAVIATHLDWGGYWREFVITQQSAAEAARRLEDMAREARCHRGLGRVYPKLDQDDKAHAHLRRALELYEALGDRMALAHTHINISLAFGRRDRYAEALHHAELAHTLYEREGEEGRRAHALNNMGWYRAHLGRHHEALASCDEALVIFQQVGDVAGQASTWDSIGFVQHRLGAYGQAVTCYENAAAIYRGIGNRLGEAETLDRLGDTHLAVGAMPAARTAWLHSLRILTQLGHDTAADVRVKLA
jgi:DNA-binding SARP family transcriptional activator